MRFATDSNHGNGWQHDCRKPKRRSPGRSSSGRQPRERSAATDPKEASGGKRGRRSRSMPRSKPLRRGSNATKDEERSNRSTRRSNQAFQVRFKSDKGAYPNRFDAFRPARTQPSSKHPAPMPREPPRRPFSGVFGLDWYLWLDSSRRAP